MLSMEPNQITIFGGKSSQGLLTTIHVIDLKKGTIIGQRSMLKKQSNPKLLFDEDKKIITFISGRRHSLSSINDVYIQTLYYNSSHFSETIVDPNLEDFDFGRASQNLAQIKVMDLGVSNGRRKSKFTEVEKRITNARSFSLNEEDVQPDFLMSDDEQKIEEVEETSFIRRMSFTDSITTDNDIISTQSLHPNRLTSDKKVRKHKYELSLTKSKFDDKNRRQSFKKLSSITKVEDSVEKIKRRNYIFGTDEFPFCFYLHRDNLESKVKSVPLDLPLKSEQGITRIAYNLIFFCGGRDFANKTVSDNAMIYNLSEKEVTKIEPMRDKKYRFGILFYENQIWIAGGITHDKMVVATCQVYCLLNSSWKNDTPDLKNPRLNPIFYQIKNELYIGGGFDQAGNHIHLIEKFDKTKNNWVLLEMQMTAFSNPRSTTLDNSNRIVLFGKSYFREISNKSKTHSSEHMKVEYIEDAEGNLNSYSCKIGKIKNAILVFGNTLNKFRILNHSFKEIPFDQSTKEAVSKIQNSLGTIFGSKLKLNECSFVTTFTDERGKKS